MHQNMPFRIHCAKSEVSIKAYTLAPVHSCLVGPAANDYFAICRNTYVGNCLCCQAHV